MTKDFKLETILTVTTGINFTDRFNDVFELAYFIFDDNYITLTGLRALKDKMSIHIFNIHPEIKNLGYVPYSKFLRQRWIEDAKDKLGSTLEISRYGEPLNTFQKKKIR